MSRLSLAVLNIGWTCTRHDLRSYFTKYGKISSIQIPMNDNGFNKRVAFLNLKTDGELSSSIFKDSHVIDGQEVTVEPKTSGPQYNVTERRIIH